jgi:SAM-dependent methyltransferase/predicted O-methyltransferase YrrM
MDTRTQIQEALANVEEMTRTQLPALVVSEREIDLAALPRFATDLPDALDSARRRDLKREIDALSPWLQGPFYLGGDLVIEGLWRNDQRWLGLRDVVGDITGKRVLDIGSNAGYDPFMFHLLGAGEVLACEPFEFIAQAQFLEGIYRTGVHLEQIGWQALDPNVHGRFDLIHCNGVLYHEPDPLGMLARLRTMLSDDGELLLGSMMLASAEHSEYARFVPADYAGDPTWWWVPGRLALRWMLDVSGFSVGPDLGVFEGPRGQFAVVNGYYRGRAKEPNPLLTTKEAPKGPANRFPIGHYYSPMYDTSELARRRTEIWPTPPRSTPGIDWRDGEQVRLCREVFAAQERLDLADEPTSDPTAYHALNNQFPPLDAWVLEGLLRSARPQRMIEVGCGYSTLVSARVNREYLDGATRLTCIEPYPRDFLEAGVPGVSELRVEKIQETPLEIFEALDKDDMLFVDTSHTVKTGGDVTWIFGEIIPRLRSGVYVHVHDIFLPGDYPEDWVLEGWGWNELYLVRAFLSFNDAFEVVWGGQYMLHHHADEVLAAFPGQARYQHRGGGSLWMRRL